MKPRIIKAADLFCGAGGTSTGAQMAADLAGVKLELTAINHWDVAIETHSANHPQARHLCADVNDVRPENFFKRGELDWLFASPECTHFSKARGGQPKGRTEEMIHKQIGNAVPPKLAEAHALAALMERRAA